MYDVVVLEDFTAFLNQRPGLRTWKKATQKQVKAWNKHLGSLGEEKLVVGNDGEEGRSDGTAADATAGDERRMVLAVEKDLEAWMVQKWCERMSVCCVLREKQRGGAGIKSAY